MVLQQAVGSGLSCAVSRKSDSESLLSYEQTNFFLGSVKGSCKTKLTSSFYMRHGLIIIK